jgi:hypothetical protein
MLMGLVGKNAILLVDFTDLLRRQGMSRTDAILQAGYTRLRPIVMTSATVLFAMLPLALKLQDGGESRAPLAVVIMGGVISSTLLTLVLVPAVYTILDDVKVLLGRMAQRLPRLAFRSRRQARPGWVLATAVAAPVNGNGHAQKQPDGYFGSSNGHLGGASNGVVHDGELRASRDGAPDERGNGDPAAGPREQAWTLPSSYLPSPSGRRRIRVVGQLGEAPAT